MQTILDLFDKKTPHYSNRFRDLIDRLSRKRAFDTSVGTEEEKFAQGKIFANYYECFLCATVLGMRHGYCLPFNLTTKGTKFIEAE